VSRLDAILKQKKGPQKPPCVVELPKSAWADGASAPIAIGLRLPAQNDYEEAAREALAASAGFAADGDEEDRAAAYNNVLMREVLARATCLAVDYVQPFFASAGALELGRRLTADGVRRLWQELELLIVSENPALPEATDEGMSHLIAIWDRGVALEKIPPEEARKIRRLIEFARQTLADVEAQADPHGVMASAG
jgi:hypothetical protein